MEEVKKREVNFVLVPTMTPREAVSLLLSRFPAMQNIICPDEDCFEQPTRAYDSFATEVVKRADDSQFLDSVGHFINDASEKKDPVLRDALIASLLEGIASDTKVTRRLYDVLSVNARKLLRDVERKIYGRIHT